MELRHLRSFVAVAKELQFSRAAERRYMAQPPLGFWPEDGAVQRLVELARLSALTWAGRAQAGGSGGLVPAVTMPVS